MTCIVGIEHDSKVYLGCDSAASDGWVAYKTDVSKIFTTDGITFGYTTSFRFADLLQYDLRIPARSETEINDRRYLVGTVIKTIRETLQKGGFAKIDNNKETGGTALLVYRNKLYSLQDDYSLVRSTDGYASCGSGHAFALGSLATTARMENLIPQQRVTMALEAAVKHCATVDGPLTVLQV